MANLDPALALAATAHIARGAKPGLLLKPINALSFVTPLYKSYFF